MMNTLARSSIKARLDDDNDGQTVESLAFGDIKNAIRTEELRLMHIEEERRYMVMRQQRNAMATHLQSSAPPPPTVAPPVQGRQQNGKGRRQDDNLHSRIDMMNKGPARQTTMRPEDISASFAWLSNPRVLQLKQRNSTRAFEFKMVAGTELTHDAKRNGSPGLVWTTDGQRAGYVLLSDVAEVKTGRDPLSFIITLRPRTAGRPDPLAIQSTGGLREVIVRANSEAECDKYTIGIQSLLASTTPPSE